MHAEHLWDIPAHRQAWERVAAQEGGFGQLYHSFCHFLETDAIYLLNDAVQTLPSGDQMQPHSQDDRHDIEALRPIWQPCKLHQHISPLYATEPSAFCMDLIHRAGKPPIAMRES